MKAEVVTPAGTIIVSLEKARELKQLYGYWYAVVVTCPYCGEEHHRNDYGAYCGLDCRIDHLREHQRRDYYNESGEEKDRLGIKR